MANLLKIKVCRTEIDTIKNKINSVETINCHEEIIELCDCCGDKLFLLATNEILTKWFVKFSDDFEQIEYLTLHDYWTGFKMLGIKIKIDKNTEVLYYLDVDGCSDEEEENYYKELNEEEEKEEKE